MTAIEPEGPSRNLRTFLIIWGGQLASAIGSEMTNFAIAIWAWEATGRATPLSLILFFTHTPRVIAACFAGILVDRWNRKQIMIVGDTMAGLSTIAILLLFWSNNLQIWHFYFAGAVNGLFGYFQNLAFSASMSAIVPKQHYTQATAMMSVRYGSAFILGPAFAGALYPLVGFVGVLLADVITFIIAVGTLAIARIPQYQKTDTASNSKITEQLTFGFRYLFKRPSLLALLIFLSLSGLISNAVMAIAPATILARTGNDAPTLASFKTAFGVGGSIGAILLSIWGGPKRRIHGLLLGNALAHLGLLPLGLTRSLAIWVPSASFSGFFMPWLGVFNQGIWLSKVEPEVQGRVFASRYFIAQVASPLGLAISGPLADYVFEPAMEPGGFLAGIFSGLFGTGTGAGLALFLTLLSCCGILVAIGGYAFEQLRDVEILLPDNP